MCKKKIKSFFGKLLCKVGFHHYINKPILAGLGTYWLQGGDACKRCNAVRISFEEASHLVVLSYERGKQESKTEFLAYGNGIKKVVALYGKEYSHKLVDDA